MQESTDDAEHAKESSDVTEPQNDEKNNAEVDGVVVKQPAVEVDFIDDGEMSFDQETDDTL